MRAFWLIVAFVTVAFDAAAASPLSYAELKRDVLANRVSTSEQLLAYFGATDRYRELVENAVLEHQSGAIHRDDVTAAKPRIVLNSGNLTMHLTADLSKPGTQLIEIAEYLPAEHRFAFHLINFALSGTELMFLDDPNTSLTDLRIQDAYDRSVGEGVFICSACHLATADGGLLPNWSASTSLLKVYGGSGDRILAGSAEAAGFQSFLAVAADPEQGRLYRRLRLGVVASSTGDLVFTKQPNRRLSEHLFKQLGARAAGSLQAHPAYPKLQFAAVAALMGCGDVSSYIPEAARGAFEARIVASIGHGELISLDRVITDADIRPEFRATYRLHPDSVVSSNRPDLAPGAYLNEQHFLSMTSRPLPQALAFVLRSTNDAVEYLTLAAVSEPQQAQQRATDAAYQAGDFLSILADLRYLYRGVSSSDVDLPLPFFNELFPLSGGGEPLPSLRFDGGAEGLQRMLAEDIGPAFLSAHPELDDFGGLPLHPRNLQTQLPVYCSRLKERSLQALQASGL